MLCKMKSRATGEWDDSIKHVKLKDGSRKPRPEPSTVFARSGGDAPMRKKSEVQRVLWAIKHRLRRRDESTIGDYESFFGNVLATSGSRLIMECIRSSRLVEKRKASWTNRRFIRQGVERDLSVRQNVRFFTFYASPTTWFVGGFC
nr:hypothetical protein Iba_chr11dCG11270 [Ipomoea batatas]